MSRPIPERMTLDQMAERNPDFAKRFSKPLPPPPSERGREAIGGLGTYSKPKEEKKDGLFSRILKGAAMPFAKTAVTGATAVESAFRFAKGDVVGAEQRLDEGYNVPFLGQVKPAKIGVDPEEQDERGMFGRETLDVVGTGAEIASFYGGGSVAKGALTAAFKSGGTKAALKVLAPAMGKEAALGALGGAGYGMQEEDATLGSVLGSAAVGGVAGAALGAAIPVAGAAGGRLARPFLKKANTADDIINSYLARESAKKVNRGAEVSIAGRTLAEINDDAFIRPGVGARKLEPKIRKKAEKIGYKPWMVSMAEEMSTDERALARQMVDLAEAKAVRGEYSAPHPQMVAAKPIMSQVEKLKEFRTTSGKRLGEIAQSLPDEAVSLRSTFTDESGLTRTVNPLGRLQQWMDEAKITLKTNDKGHIVDIDFSKSMLRGSTFKTEREMLKQTVEEFLTPGLQSLDDVVKSPKQIMETRRILREYSERLKPANPTQKAHPVKHVIDGLRKDLLDPISAVSPDFYNANKSYAIAESALNRFYKRFVGSKFVDAEDVILEERLGEIMRRLASNGASTPRMHLSEMRQSLGQLFEISGQKMPDIMNQDPQRLVELTHVLNDLYDLHKLGGFQKSVERGAVQKVMAGMEAVSANPLQVISGISRLTGGNNIMKARQMLGSLLGEPAEEVIESLPKTVQKALRETTEEVVEEGSESVLRTIGDPAKLSKASDGKWTYGAFDLQGKPVEKFAKEGPFAEQLGDIEFDSDQFRIAWKKLGEAEPEKFALAQRDFVDQEFLAPQVAKLQEAGYNLEDYSEGIRDFVREVVVKEGGDTDVVVEAIKATGGGVNEVELTRKIIELMQPATRGQKVGRTLQTGARNRGLGIVDREDDSLE